MSDEIKKPFDLGPILPMFGAGVDLGERLGDLAAGQKQLENSLKEVKQDIKELDTKTDKMAYVIHRLDERTKTDHTLLIGLWVTVVAGFIIQFFSK